MSENRDHAGELIAWLADKSEDVWFDAAGHLDWDDGAWVKIWMVDQPKCTQQVAARMFWAADPTSSAEHLLNGGELNLNAEADMIVDRILKNWRKGLYRKGEIAFEGWGPNSGYQALLARYAPRPDPLNVPAGLFERFEGRMPVLDASETPVSNPWLWDLYVELGILYVDRPESAGPTPPKTTYRQPQPVSAVSARSLGIFLTVVSLSLLSLIYWFG